MTRIVRLTENEHDELLQIMDNGWGDGDFAGWGGANVATQKRAMQKLADAPCVDPVRQQRDELLAALEAMVGEHEEGNIDSAMIPMARAAIAKAKPSRSTRCGAKRSTDIVTSEIHEFNARLKALKLGHPGAVQPPTKDRKARTMSGQHENAAQGSASGSARPSAACGHTPGPWVLCEDSCVIRSPKRVVLVTHDDMGKPLVDAGDAQLIAAAPELLAALEAFAPEDPFFGDELSGGPACIGCGSDRHNAWHSPEDVAAAEHPCPWVLARAAIAKAKGQIAKASAENWEDLTDGLV